MIVLMTGAAGLAQLLQEPRRRPVPRPAGPRPVNR